METTIIERCDIAAYRTWARQRVGPSHLRGLPTWAWRSALMQHSDRLDRSAAA